MEDTVMLILGLLVAAVGALMIAAFVSSYLRCRTRVEATVCRVETKSHYFRGQTIREYIPVFSYSVGGKTYTAKADVSVRNPDRFAVGQKETLFVSARQPSVFRFGSHVPVLLWGLIFFACGVGVLILRFM